MKRIWRGVWFAILAIMSVAFIGMAWMASRTHWHTYTITASAFPELRLAVDCPDNWQPDTKEEYADSGGMMFKPKQPMGWNRWWIKNILRQPINGSNDAKIRIRLEPRMAENKDIDSVERSSRSAMSQMSKFLRKCVIHRTRYRLGQALDMTLELRQAAPASYIHAIAIFPDAKSEYGKVFISIECGTTPDQLPRIEPVIESMIQRIRLVPAGK